MNRIEDLFALMLELRVQQQPSSGAQPSDDDVRATAKLFAQGLRIAAFLMTVAGGLVGFITVASLVRDAGSSPINLIGLIAVTMLLPLAMVLVTLLLMVLSGRGGQTTWGDLALWVVRASVTLASKALDRTSPQTQWKTQAALGVARGDYAILEPVLPWTALRLTQRFALALSAGFSLALLMRMIGTDLTFGWQTTIDGVASLLPTLVQALSLPFGWLSEDLRLSDAFIAATRFERFSHNFVGGPAAAHASGAWWPFLIVGGLFWGLVPRIAVLIVVGRQERRAVANVLQTHAPLRELQQRLQRLNAPPPVVDKDAVLFDRPDEEDHEYAPDALARAAKQQPALRPQPKPAVDAKPLRAVALYWQHDTPPDAQYQASLESALGVHAELTALFGNRAASDDECLTRVHAHSPDIVLLYVEHFVAPNAGFVRALARLRDVLPATSPILVVLAWFEEGTPQPIAPRTLELWTQKLQSLGDARIRLHTAPAPAPPKDTP